MDGFVRDTLALREDNWAQGDFYCFGLYRCFGHFKAWLCDGARCCLGCLGGGNFLCLVTHIDQASYRPSKCAVDLVLYACYAITFSLDLGCFRLCFSARHNLAICCFNRISGDDGSLLYGKSLVLW